MKKLKLNWFTEGLQDFEYKKYILLAYLQQIHKSFTENRLYPHLAELYQHYQSLQLFLKTKETMYKEFPKKLSKLDFERFKIEYEKTIHDDELMETITRVVEYSIPKLKTELLDGKNRYNAIEASIYFSPVGIIPIYKNEGYLMLKSGKTSNTDVYQYQITLFENSGEQYRGIHTTWVANYPNTMVYTFEGIKKELIKTREVLPNPATYLAETKNFFPQTETLLPIAKRLLVQSVVK
jgi:hypothetical protein